MQLHVRTYGSGPPLIVLHGLFGSSENWETISRRFSASFQVLAVDQRNHGRSPHSPEMSYPLMAEDLRELLEERGLERACVLGHSMGGKTAMQFALQHPARVERLVVVDIAPRAYAPRHQRIFQGLLSLDVARFESRKQMEEALAPFIPNLAVRRFLLKNVAAASDGGFRWRMGLHEIQDNYDRLGAALSADRPFSGPTLFIRGEQSDYLQEADLAWIRPLFPRAELAVVGPAGHWVHAEAPEALFRTIREFFLSRSTAGEERGGVVR